MSCTLALNVTCTTKTQNGIDRRNQILIFIVCCFFYLVHNLTAQFELQSYVCVVTSIYIDLLFSES